MDLRSIKKHTYVIIRTDGREEVIEKRPHIPTILRDIGAETLDFITVGKAVGNDIIMVVDDEGWETRTIYHGGGRVELKPVRARKPINAKATALYHAICIPGTKHQIVGDVALWHDGESLREDKSD